MKNLERAVVRLQAYDKDPQTGKATLAKSGTAWFITRDRLLTAAHCIGDRPSEAAHAGPFRLVLPGTDAAPAPQVEVDVEAQDWALDVAVLKLRQPLADVATLPLGALPVAVPAQAGWIGYGFPTGNPTGLHPHGAAIFLRGNVAGQQALELDNAIGGFGGLEGLSGGPVCVSGLAVGLIRYGVLDQKVILATAVTDLAALLAKLAPPLWPLPEASFAPPPPPPDPAWQPAPPGKNFFGREEELQRLRDTVMQRSGDRGICVGVINGPAGIGKRELARRYVQVFREAYQAAFWLRGSADLPRLPDYLKQPDSQPWLVVVEADPEQLAPLLHLVKDTGPGLVLVITTAQDCRPLEELDRCQLRSFPLQAFSKEDALGFLQKRLQRPFPAEDHDAAAALCERLFRYPALLNTAGDLISGVFSVSLRDYLEALNDKKGLEETFKAVLAASIEACAQQSDLVEDLLNAAALLAEAPIPAAIFQSRAALPDSPLARIAKKPVVLLKKALDALGKMSLISYSADGKAFTVMPMLRALRESAMDDAKLTGWLRCLALATSQFLDESAAAGAASLCMQLVPHVRYLAVKMRLNSAPAADVLALMEGAGETLRSLKILEEAQLFIQESSRTREVVFLDAQEAMVKSLSKLGLVEQGRDHHEEALTCFRRALELCQANESNLTRAEILYKSVLNNLRKSTEAVAALVEGKRAELRALAEEKREERAADVATILVAILDKYRMELAITLAGLAKVLWLQNRAPEAEALFR